MNHAIHSGLLQCSNSRYPAIYTRLDHPDILSWLLTKISENVKEEPEKTVQVTLEKRCEEFGNGYQCLELNECGKGFNKNQLRYTKLVPMMTLFKW